MSEISLTDELAKRRNSLPGNAMNTLQKWLPGLLVRLTALLPINVGPYQSSKSGSDASRARRQLVIGG